MLKAEGNKSFWCVFSKKNRKKALLLEKEAKLFINRAYRTFAAGFLHQKYSVASIAGWGNRVVDHARKILTFSPMITSRLTSKAQTTIPQAVRTALGLRPGDSIAYHIEDGRAVLTRLSPNSERDDPFGTFSEWASTADAKAYGQL